MSVHQRADDMRGSMRLGGLIALTGLLSIGCKNDPPTPCDGGTCGLSPELLSGAGESCTRTADCKKEFICLSQTCVSSDASVPVARVSHRGEACRSTSDCEASLVCWPLQGASGVPQLLGVCDLASFGITPSNKTCSSECKTPADCCELPTSSHGTFEFDGGEPLSDGGRGLLVHSCEDLATVMGLPNPSICDQVQTDPRACFLYKTYCDCGMSNPWTCTDNHCRYSAACNNNGETIKGCPTRSRANFDLPATCTSNKCSQPLAACQNDLECEGKKVADADDKCTKNECVCASGACYRHCANDLECAQGSICDRTKRVCVVTACESDSYCQRTLGTINARCVQGNCRATCHADLDCNGSGLRLLGGRPFLGQVCAQELCVDIGCSADSECSADTSNVRMFCQTPPAISSGPTYHSAITN